MKIIYQITPKSKGLYFTNMAYGELYMKRYSDIDQIEYMGYELTNKGFYLEPREGINVEGKKVENKQSGAYPYTEINKGKIIIEGQTYKVFCAVHTHLFNNVFSGLPLDWRKVKGFEHLGVFLGADGDGDWFKYQNEYWYKKAEIDNFAILGNTDRVDLHFNRSKVYEPLLKNGYGAWHDFTIKYTPLSKFFR